MSRISDLNDQLACAMGLEAVLTAGYRALDAIVMTIRGREDPATGAFAALVMSAAAAVDGRDALARAPSLSLREIRHTESGRADSVAEPASGQLTGDQAALTGLAALAGHAAVRLAEAGHDAVLASDQEACAQAAACAREIHDLLAGNFDE